MTITVDQTLCQPDLLADATLGDAMAWLQESIATSGKVVIKVEMDGQTLQGPALQTARSWPIRQRVIAFSTADERTLARTTIGKLAALIEYLHGQHVDTAQLLEQNQTPKALAKLGEIISAWSQIHTAYSNMITMLRLDLKKLPVRQLTADQVLANFASQLVSMQQALQNQDMVMLADILQYEMDGAIETWVSLLEATMDRL